MNEKTVKTEKPEPKQRLKKFYFPNRKPVEATDYQDALKKLK